ncbi:MAG: short-chain dehydrogenase [Comamonas sp. SCN 65-56]|uniref:SDR family oxidoreductase n=1 Tax=Comamonas flocculans TaxID=2597701 RepID=A0A5B8RX46_9BURK|nr:MULTISPECIES: SDR family oxidoreductase [Comamonas]ODS90813.1 MAG: short-chain dehydrogenase [Comamonas sp. SCN 65-56]QEA13294.1 SDR family oxidoreductase [Comamonas flocculans]
MKVRFDYSGCHVMVFGGTTGINLGIAQAFAAAGARVTVASRKQVNVNAAMTALGGLAFGVVCDVRNEACVRAALAAAVARHGPINVLVSGAAGNFLAQASEMSANAFKVVVDIDLIGSFHVAHHAYPHLHKPGASVIFISAPQAVVPMPGQSHVGAAKAGVDQFARVLALEWGAAGVRVNVITPGPIEGTEGMKRLAPQGEEGDALVRALVPLGRMGTPQDIANLAMFLGSDAASYLSGAVIACDGGAQNMLTPMIRAAAQQEPPSSPSDKETPP